MANTDVSRSTLEQISALSQLHYVRQLIFMVLLAAGIALGIAVVLWSRSSDFTPLYMSLSPADSTEVVTALEQMGTEYKINAANGVISVPLSQLEQVRLQLASQGLPRNTSIGYEILSQDQSLSTSNFIEQARFNHALEQELTHTIKFIRNVRDARVHLSIPKQTSFIRDSNKPTASVMLNLADGQTPAASQLAGIVHLVASSVSGLTPDNVSIVDQYGNLLSQKKSAEYELSAEHLRITREIEDEYTRKIIDILSPVVGHDNIRAQVSADIDFTVIETTLENYDPDSTVIRSEQIQEERAQVPTTSTVEPGTLSQTPPQPQPQQAATETVTTTEPMTTRVNATRNFEVDRSVSIRKNVPGTITRLSVAVLVDMDGRTVDLGNASADAADADAAALAAEQQVRIDRLTQLVRDTIGYNQARGDSVNVISEQFAQVETVEFDDSLAFLKQDWIIPLVKQVLAGLVVIVLIFGVLKPTLKSTLSHTSPLPNRLGAPVAAAGNAELAGDSVELSTAALEQKAPKKSEYDQNLALVQQVVQAEPVRAARMIKEWVSDV